MWREMLRVLNTPFEKITGKEIAMVSGRTSTVRQEAAQPLEMETVRVAVAEGFADMRHHVRDDAADVGVRRRVKDLLALARGLQDAARA